MNKEQAFDRFVDMVDCHLVDIREHGLTGVGDNVITEVLTYIHATKNLTDISEQVLYDYVEEETGFTIDEIVEVENMYK